MQTINFAKRNFKEIFRDPLCIIFSILLPLFLLIIFQQIEIPSPSYKIENFTPGIIVFSLAFISMFVSILLAKDRNKSLLIRLQISPMKTIEYILGYILALLPIVFLQSITFFITAIILKLKFTWFILIALLIILLCSILFINLGIIIGCITTENSAAGASSVIVQLVAFTSNMYFEVDMLGAFFATLCDILPFYHCVNLIKGVLLQTYNNYFLSIIIVLIYLVISFVLAIILFERKLVK